MNIHGKKVFRRIGMNGHIYETEDGRFWVLNGVTGGFIQVPADSKSVQRAIRQRTVAVASILEGLNS